MQLSGKEFSLVTYNTFTGFSVLNIYRLQCSNYFTAFSVQYIYSIQCSIYLIDIVGNRNYHRKGISEQNEVKYDLS